MRECDSLDSGARIGAGCRRDAVRDAKGGAAAPVSRPRARGFPSGVAGGRRARGGGERRPHQLPQAAVLPADRRGGHIRGSHRGIGPGRREKRSPASQDRSDRGAAGHRRSQEDTSP